MNSSAFGLGLIAKKIYGLFFFIYSYCLYNVGSCYLKNKVSRKCVSPEVLDCSIQSHEKNQNQKQNVKEKKK